MKKNKIEEFSLNELKSFRSFIDDYININALKQELDISIKEKENRKKDFNNKLTIELMRKLHFFDNELFEILDSHSIKNIQDLIDSDLNKWDLTHQRKLELEEAKVWYDFSRLEENIEKVKKKGKK